MCFPLVLVLSPLWFSWGNAFQLTIDLPDNAKPKLDACILQSKDTPVIPWQAKLACLHDYFSDLGPNNLTYKDWAVFRRTNEAGFGHFPPSTGISTRQEVRALSKGEWRNITDVFRQLFNAGTLQSFGRLHGIATHRAHKGAAFLPWHRVFLTHFEQEMRNINPSVSLPYWDYTIDYDIAQPFESVLWTPCYFGENDDVVKSSSFSFLYGAHGAIISRNIANNVNSTRLISKADMDLLKGYCNFKDITTGAKKKNETHNLEYLHDSVHDYIGGDMGVVENSAYDPIFWFHHAFIDYIWEDFRKHQTEKCSITDLELDYRPLNDLGRNTSIEQGPFDTMFGYSHLRNIDGLWLNWTQKFYTYEHQPVCGTSCKGEYLFCNDKGRCLTRTKESCTERPSNIWLDAHDRGSLEPKLPCDTGTELKGLKGDGRTRFTSKAECEDILKHERKEGSPHQEQTNNSESHQNTAATVLGIMLGVVLLIGLVSGICVWRRLQDYQRI